MLRSAPDTSMGEGLALETNGECTERQSAGGVTAIYRKPLIKDYLKYCRIFASTLVKAFQALHFQPYSS